MKHLFSFAIIGILSAGIIGCEASAEVGDDDETTVRTTRTDNDTTYKKTTTTVDGDGDKTTRTEIRRD